MSEDDEAVIERRGKRKEDRNEFRIDDEHQQEGNGSSCHSDVDDSKCNSNVLTEEKKISTRLDYENYSSNLIMCETPVN